MEIRPCSFNPWHEDQLSTKSYRANWKAINTVYREGTASESNSDMSGMLELSVQVFKQLWLNAKSPNG